MEFSSLELLIFFVFYYSSSFNFWFHSILLANTTRAHTYFRTLYCYHITMLWMFKFIYHFIRINCSFHSLLSLAAAFIPITLHGRNFFLLLHFSFILEYFFFFSFFYLLRSLFLIFFPIISEKLVKNI